jgi:hypothetical protein
MIPGRCRAWNLSILLKEEPMAMDFPIDDLMDEDACYGRLLGILHPGELV